MWRSDSSGNASRASGAPWRSALGDAVAQSIKEVGSSISIQSGASAKLARLLLRRRHEKRERERLGVFFFSWMRLGLAQIQERACLPWLLVLSLFFYFTNFRRPIKGGSVLPQRRGFFRPKNCARKQRQEKRGRKEGCQKNVGPWCFGLWRSSLFGSVSL